MVRDFLVSGVKWLLRLGLGLYFKEIRHSQRQIDQSRPLLFLANHQNALIDALLIAAFNQRKTFFLVRSGVFKRKPIARVLYYLGMRPIYRIRDGKHMVSQNEPIMNFFAEKLVQGNCVLIFPEGNHSLKRTVRPLRKGFIEIADKALALNPDLDLGLVTVGLSYQNAKCARDRVVIHYADTIDAQKLFLTQNSKKERDKELLVQLHERLSAYTVHIPSSSYDSLLQQLIQEKIDFLQVNAVNARIDALIESTSGISKEANSLFNYPCERTFLYSVLYVLFWPVVIFWRLLIRPKIKEDEFVSTFRFAYLSLLLLLLSLLLFSLFLAGLMQR